MPAPRRSLSLVTALGAAAVLVAGTTPAGAATGPVSAGGTFAVPADAGTAFTYDPAQVPVGARVSVHAVPTGNGRTVVTLHVKGLLPGETYGAHAHYLPCGQTGGAAGAHYQDVPDPAVGGSLTAASVDPEYANPANEIWLDLATNPAGNGHAQTVVDWQFRPTEPSGARSVVLHLNETSHGGTPPAGNAGPRLACVTVAF